MKYKFILFLFLTILASCKSPTDKKIISKNHNEDKNNYSSKLDSLLESKTPRKFNGVVLITKNGKTLYSKALGYSNFQEKIPINFKDNFRIQSNSKQITAVLVLKEVEKGNIDLEKYIIDYLPYFKKSWAKKVTLHQLLNMSSGVVDVKKPLLFEPGEGFHYSNAAYGILGEIIEKITGKTYVENANILFKNLGMKNTYCYQISKPNKNLINGYWVSEDELEVVNFETMNFTEKSWNNFIPGGGIISNALDLNIWDQKLHNGQIINKELYEEMINSKVIDADYTFSDKKSNYGYGVNINEEKPMKYIGHAGRGIGFVNLKIYIPKEDLDIIILENVYNRNEDIVYYFEKNIRKIVLNSNLIHQ